MLLSGLSIKAQVKTIQLNEEGFVRMWNVAGPFEQSIYGFGDVGDKEFIKETADVNQLLENADNDLLWIPKQINGESFLDLKNIFGRVSVDEISKIWHVKAAYAFATINCGEAKTVKALFGGNSIAKVIVNGEIIYSNNQTTNAVRDEIVREINLREGENYILLKVFNSNENYSVSFFAPLKYDWGFYCRLTDAEGNAPSSIHQEIEDGLQNNFTLTQTYFMKDINGKLCQKLYLDVYSNKSGNVNTVFMVNLSGSITEKILPLIYGHNFFEVYIPVIEKEIDASAKLAIGEEVINKEFNLLPQKKYEIHLMFLSHMDIGYTDPQPVVKEKHIKTLDDVVTLAKKDPEFKWTIETVWQLEQYRLAKSEKEFDELIDLIKQGRIAVSPLYANPFTGWISEEEAIESLRPASELRSKYDLKFNAVVYNDVPGESQFIPQLLSSAGVYFLSNGINEIYNDYSFQRNLPKVFWWQGSNSSKIIAYIHESYVEGKNYGLERDTDVVENRIWLNIDKLIKRGYNYDMILLDAGYFDNAGLAFTEYQNALKWNEEYAYPKFVISNLSQFAEEFKDKYANDLPVVKGDFTSTWDILSQGEAERNIKLKWVQNNSLSAAKLAGALWLSGASYKYPTRLYNDIFQNSLLFSGHGSGMEFGFGNAFDNYITDAYRDEYIERAEMDTYEFLLRSSTLLSQPFESLDNFGIIVFNPLSWDRDEIVNVEFKYSEDAGYSVIDLATGKKVESFYKSPILSFKGTNLPAMGYKNFKLVRNNNNSTEQKVDTNFIENKYYKITVNTAGGSIESIYDKQLELTLEPSSAKIAAAGKLEPRPFDLTKDLFASTQNVKLGENENVAVQVEANSLYQKIIVKNRYNLLPQLEITLYNDDKSIDVKAKFDLRKLSQTDITENYNMMLPFVDDNSHVIFDLLGSEYSYKQRPNWIGHNSYSIRDYVRIVNDDCEIVIASPDARVFTLDKTGNGAPVTLKVNLANNFPVGWNRNEKNDAVLEYHFSITSGKKSEDNLSAMKFAAEKVAPSIVKKTWFNNNVISEQFINIDNPNVVLNNVSPIGDDVVLHLRNISESAQNAEIDSKYFIGKKIALQNIWGEEIKSIPVGDSGEIKIELKGKEIQFLKISRN